MLLSEPSSLLKGLIKMYVMSSLVVAFSTVSWLRRVLQALLGEARVEVRQKGDKKLWLGAILCKSLH